MPALGTTGQSTWPTARRGAQGFCPRLRSGPSLVNWELSLLTEGGKIEIELSQA
jgi:hypothetical protein